MKNSVEYLEHIIIDANGLRATPGKIAAIMDNPQPQNLRQLQSFLGFEQLEEVFAKFSHNNLWMLKNSENSKEHPYWI